MTVEVNGVCEKYGPDQEKIYAISTLECECTFYCNHQAPCRHILFKRENDDLSMFDQILFHTRYHKQRGGFSHSDSRESEKLLEDFSEDYNEMNEESKKHREVLDVRQKYNMILPVALSIASLASNHGTKQFKDYLSSLKEVESIVRAGSSMQCLPLQDNCKSITSPENNGKESSVSCENVSTAAENEGEQSNGSRFLNLKFKRKVKTRGRPKNASRQLCSFNRSLSDRTAQPTKQKQRKTKVTDPAVPSGGPTTRKRLRLSEDRPAQPKEKKHRKTKVTDPAVPSGGPSTRKRVGVAED